MDFRQIFTGLWSLLSHQRWLLVTHSLLSTLENASQIRLMHPSRVTTLCINRNHVRIKQISCFCLRQVRNYEVTALLCWPLQPWFVDATLIESYLFILPVWVGGVNERQTWTLGQEQNTANSTSLFVVVVNLGRTQTNVWRWRMGYSSKQTALIVIIKRVANIIREKHMDRVTIDITHHLPPIRMFTHQQLIVSVICFHMTAWRVASSAENQIVPSPGGGCAVQTQILSQALFQTTIFWLIPKCGSAARLPS